MQQNMERWIHTWKDSDHLYIRIRRCGMDAKETAIHQRPNEVDDSTYFFLPIDISELFTWFS